MTMSAIKIVSHLKDIIIVEHFIFIIILHIHVIVESNIFTAILAKVRLNALVIIVKISLDLTAKENAEYYYY